MKKLFLIMAFALGAITMSAQRAGDYAQGGSNDDEWSHSAMFIEPHVGGVVGDVEGDVGFGVNFGYRWHIASGFCWDVLKAGYNTNSDDFGSWNTLRFTSGFRYNTARIVADKSLYFTVAFGYYLNLNETDLHGFAYDLGAGVNLSRNISLGISWEGSKYYSAHWGEIGLKLGYQF